MSVQLETIITRVRTQLIDNGSQQRWSDQELMNWICDGQRAIVLVAPRASQVTAVVPYVAGSRQTIPSGGYMFLAAYRDMGANGTSPGNTLVKTPREFLDVQYPTWHSMTPVQSPTAYCFDDSDPLAFYVFQPADGTGYVEINYSVMPTDQTSTSALIQVADVYQTPLFDYCMYRATQKDGDYSMGQGVAATYYGAFSATLANLLKDQPSTATQQTGGA